MSEVTHCGVMGQMSGHICVQSLSLQPRHLEYRYNVTSVHTTLAQTVISVVSCGLVLEEVTALVDGW